MTALAPPTGIDLHLYILGTLLVGFAVTIPVIGHASWRAYVATVDSAAAPPRE